MAQGERYNTPLTPAVASLAEQPRAQRFARRLALEYERALKSGNVHEIFATDLNMGGVAEIGEDHPDFIEKDGSVFIGDDDTDFKRALNLLHIELGLPGRLLLEEDVSRGGFIKASDIPRGNYSQTEVLDLLGSRAIKSNVEGLYAVYYPCYSYEGEMEGYKISRYLIVPPAQAT